MSLKPGHWNTNFPSGKWEHSMPADFANLDEVLDWCEREFPDYATCMRYVVYDNKNHFIFYNNQNYVAFLLRWA